MIGRICMDQTMLDVTDCPEAQVGDTVLLAGGEGPGFEELAGLAGKMCIRDRRGRGLCPLISEKDRTRTKGRNQIMKDMTKKLLEMVSDLFGEPDGAYNIREDGACAGRKSSRNVEIVSKTDKPGIDRCV